LIPSKIKKNLSTPVIFTAINFVRVLKHNDAIIVEKMYNYKKKIRKLILIGTVMVIEQKMIKPYMVYIICYYNNFNRQILSKTKLVVSGMNYDSYFDYITL